MRRTKYWVFGVLILTLSLWVSAPSAGLAASSVSSEKIEPTKNQASGAMERLSQGASNILYGPLEIPYQLKEEIKRHDPFRGLIPGLLKGIGWMGVREAVGLFEVFTFYAPDLGPELKSFDTDWLYA